MGISPGCERIEGPDAVSKIRGWWSEAAPTRAFLRMRCRRLTDRRSGSGSSATPALLTCFGGPFSIVGEVAATFVAALAACFRGALTVAGEVAAAFVPALASCGGGERPVLRKATLFVRDALPPLGRNRALLGRIHGCESAIGCSRLLLCHRRLPRCPVNE